MASVNKQILSTSTLLKPSSADAVSEVIILPAYAEEVLLVSETGVSLSSGTVLTCKLEHSPNGIDWVDVKVEEITSSSGGSNFGNEWYVNTIPGAGEDKNKHVQLYSGFTSGGSADDVISSQMEVGEPFTTSMWLKSTEVPATTTSTYPTNYIAFDGGDHNSHKDCILISALGDDGGGYETGPIGCNKNWSLSFWIKTTSTGIGHNLFITGNNSNHYLQSTYENGLIKMYKHLGGVGTSNGVAYFSHTAIKDDAWHHITYSYKGTNAAGTDIRTANESWFFDPITNGTTTSINDAGITVYIDGVRAAYDASTSSGATEFINNTGQNFAPDGGFGEFIFLGQDASQYWKDAPAGDYACLAIHDETISSAKAVTLYNSGDAYDLRSDSNTIVFLDFADETAAAAIPSANNPLTNSGGSSDASNHTCNVQSFSDDEYTTTSASSETIYKNTITTTYSPILFRCGGKTAVPDFGEGLTLSLTDKVKTDGTWNTSGGENPHLLLSFDGFENDAAQWLAWKCTQDIDNDAATADVNFLDGAWHNLVISYRGVTVSNAGSVGTLRGLFSKSVTGDLDNSHLVLTIDAKPLYHINGNKSVDAAKVKDGAGFAYIDMLPQHLRNVSDTYVRTSFLGSGLYTELYGATGDSPYAYQGDCDEISFHKDTFWKDPGTPGIVCGCPLEVLYGNNSERTTAEPGIPHDLMDPSTVQTDPVTTLTAYLEPFPTGVERCNENIATHTTKTICDNGTAAHSVVVGTGDGSVGNTNFLASTGGLELWYRWGDTPADCAICVKDVRETETTGATTRGGEIKGDLSTSDLTKMTGAAGETVYKAGGGAGGTQKDHVVFTQDSVSAGPHLVTHLNLPHLHYLRAVYTGDGVNTDGSLVSSLYYSRRKS